VVTEVRRDDDSFLVRVAEGVLRARKVVVATGPFQRARIPAFASEVAPAVLQTDPSRYWRPQDLPEGAVLVVGSGASGCQIAEELRRVGRRVFLSVSRHRRVPRRFRGQDVYWWLDRMGRFATSIDSFPGREWPPSTVVTGVSGGYDVDVRRMAAEGIRVIGRITGASGCRLSVARNANEVLDEADETFAGFLDAAREFAAAHPAMELSEETPVQPAARLGTIDETEALDLRKENITSIVWATGYDYDFDWLQLPVLDERGRPRQHRGLSPVPGMYFLGLHWMHTFKSGLLSGVGDDAEYLAEAIDSPTS
jgi:putative flavoprotein involved in K+ transport